MQVSLIVRNYNYGRFLRQAVDSALAQTYPGVQVIVVDDGSTDDSADIIHSYGDRILPVLKANEGPASAVDAGFEKTTGEIIFLLDADDTLDADAVETVIRVWETEIIAVHFPLRILQRDGSLQGRMPPEHTPLDEGDVLPRLLRTGVYTHMPTSGNAIHRRLYERIYPNVAWRSRLEPGSPFFDTLSVATAPFFGKFRAIPQPLGTHRLHDTNSWSSPDAWTSWEKIRHKYESSQCFDRVVRHWARLQNHTVTPDLLLHNFNYVRAALSGIWLHPGRSFEPGHTLPSALLRAVRHLVWARSNLSPQEWCQRYDILLKPVLTGPGLSRLLGLTDKAGGLPTKPPHVYATRKLKSLNQELRKAVNVIAGRVQGRIRRRPESRLGVQEYCERHGQSWHPVDPAVPYPGGRSRTTGSRPLDFSSLSPTHIPETGVAEIPNGLLLGAAGWVISPEGHHLVDQSAFSLPTNYWPANREWQEVVQLPGTCVTLVAEWARYNYAHYLHDGLSRLDVFLRSGLDPSSVDFFCCACPSPRLYRMLHVLGIPEGKCVWVEEGRAYQADRLIFAHYPHTFRCLTPRTVEFLRARFHPQPGPTRRRLYVQRQTNRRIVNEAELLPLLQEFGFEIYRCPEDVLEQHRIFAEAEFVVGVHGADLANLVFSRPGTKILEIISTDFTSPYFYHLAAAAGLEHFHLVGTSTTHRPAGSPGAGPHDVQVDADELRKALALMCAP